MRSWSSKQLLMLSGNPLQHITWESVTLKMCVRQSMKLHRKRNRLCSKLLKPQRLLNSRRMPIRSFNIARLSIIRPSPIRGTSLNKKANLSKIAVREPPRTVCTTIINSQRGLWSSSIAWHQGSHSTSLFKRPKNPTEPFQMWSKSECLMIKGWRRSRISLFPKDPRDPLVGQRFQRLKN